jgi:hypothetical protein
MSGAHSLITKVERLVKWPGGAVLAALDGPVPTPITELNWTLM